MKRLAALALLVMLISLMTSLAASAKDPFKPLVTEQGQQTQAASQQETVSPAPVSTSPSSQGSALPLTGIYADLWFGGGVMLIVVGVALLVLERFYRGALDQTRVFLSAQ